MLDGPGTTGRIPTIVLMTTGSVGVFCVRLYVCLYVCMCVWACTSLHSIQHLNRADEGKGDNSATLHPHPELTYADATSSHDVREEGQQHHDGSATPHHHGVLQQLAATLGAVVVVVGDAEGSEDPPHVVGADKHGAESRQPEIVDQDGKRLTHSRNLAP